MNSEIPENESNVPETPGPERPESKEPPAQKTKARPAIEAKPDVSGEKPRKGGSGLSLLALLIALASLAGTAWMWWQDQSQLGQEEERIFSEIARLESRDSELSLKLDQIRDELDLLDRNDVTGEFADLQRRIESDRGKLTDIEQSIREQLALSRSLQAATESMQGRLMAAEAAVSGMSTRELDAGGELDLDEVDYLLRLANERLKLFSDPQAADQALEVADMHLAALDNPMYLGVRQDIASARRMLAAVDVPDYLEISARLDAVQQAIPALPFKGEPVVASAEAAEEGEGWWAKVKSVFSGLVTVRRSTEAENEKISLQDKDFIRQRIWLQLEIAHLSLMRRDEQAFRTSLTRAQASMTEWFDPADSRFQEASGQIESLAELAIDVEIPDITAPWSTLRMLRGTRPPTPPAPAAETGSMPEPVAESEEESEDDPAAGEETG